MGQLGCILCLSWLELCTTTLVRGASGTNGLLLVVVVLTRGQILDQSIVNLKPSKFIEYLIPSWNLKPCGLGTWRIRFCPIHWSTRGKLSRLALCDKIDPVQVANSTSRWLFLSASTFDTSSCKPYQANVSALCTVLVEESVPTQVKVVNLCTSKPNPTHSLYLLLRECLHLEPTRM